MRHRSGAGSASIRGNARYYLCSRELFQRLSAPVLHLRNAGAQFRSDVIQGVGGMQALVEDPSGNPIELFQPAGA